MDQKDNWKREYISNKGVPTTTRLSPSSSVIKTISYLQSKKLIFGKRVIDLGCGIGRNTIFLAESGFDVTAVDFVESALDKLRDQVQKRGLKIVKIVNASISEKLPFLDNSFDLALDIVSTMSLDNRGIKMLESEIKRILKPNGIFVSYILSNDDEYMLKYGNKDKGTYLVPDSNIVEYCRSKEELKKIYKNWEILKEEKIEKKDHFYGDVYTRRLWWLILKNRK